MKTAQGIRGAWRTAVMRPRYWLIALILTLVMPAQASATGAVMEAHVKPSYPVYQDMYNYFGWSVDIEGNTLLVGDYLSGASTLFGRSGGGWAQTDVLHSEGGQSVTLSNGRAVIGNTPIFPAAVYPVTAGTFDVGAASFIGAGTADADGDLLVTAAIDRVSVFRDQSGAWTHAADVPLDRPEPYLPPSVAVSGDTFAVISGGEPLRIFTMAADGTVTEVAEFASVSTPFDETRIAFAGDLLVVGTPSHVDAFRRTAGAWAPDGECVPSALSPNSMWGMSVDTDGSRIVAGASRNLAGGGPNPGNAYVFDRTAEGWIEVLSIPSPTPSGEDHFGNLRGPDFGRAVALDGDRVAIGAYSETTDGDGTGAAYVYRIFDDATGIPEGNDVVVSTEGVTLRFSQVTGAGTLEITRRQPTHSVPASKRWVAGGSYDIHPTATFSGPVQVTVTFDDDDVRRPETLELMHFNGAEWETVSTGRTATTITGTVNSFSEFAVAESSEASAAPAVVSTPASSAWSMVVAGLLALFAAAVARRRTVSGT